MKEFERFKFRQELKKRSEEVFPKMSLFKRKKMEEEFEKEIFGFQEKIAEEEIKKKIERIEKERWKIPYPEKRKIFRRKASFLRNLLKN